MRCCTSDGGAGIEGGWTADLRGTWENTPEGYREGPTGENKGDPVANRVPSGVARMSHDSALSYAWNA